MATPTAPSSLPLRIFLSSTSQDLFKHRGAVVKVIHSLGLLPIYMETFGASPKDPLETCRELAESADAMVVIVGHRYGHVPNQKDGKRKSIVWHEVETAAKYGKPLFCYFAKEKRTAGGIGEEDRERLAEFRHFLDELNAVVYDRFSSPADLAMRVAIALGKWLLQDRARDFVTALRLIDFDAHPSPPEALQTAKFLPASLLDKILAGSELTSGQLDPLLEGEQLPAARKSLAEGLARTRKETLALKERLAKVRTQERELSARIELLERERPPNPSVLPALIFDFERDSPQLQEQRRQRRQAYETDLQLYRGEMERHRTQLEWVRQSADQIELSLTRLRQEGESEHKRREREIAAARAKDIVHLLHGLQDRALRWLEDSGTTGQGFLLLLSTTLAIPALSRHLAGYAAEAMWADQIAQRLSRTAEEAVRRDPQALGRDSLALAMVLRKGLEEGERTTAEVRRVLDGVSAEGLQCLSLKQQKLLRFVSPGVESFESLSEPDSIARATEKVERRRVELADTLTAIRALEAESATLQEMAEKANARAADLRRRWSSRVSLLLPRLEDCRRVWTILSRAAAESSGLGGEVRRFCACLRAEAERRLGEPPEPLVVRCQNRAFGLSEAEATCAKHPVTAYLARAEELRRRRLEWEAQAAELDRASRKLAEWPRRWAEEYRQELRRAALRAVAPWIGLMEASKIGTLVRRSAPTLRSNHRDYRSLTRWSLPWLHGAALVSALGTVCLGFAIAPVLADRGSLWAVVLALSALGYLLGLALWTTQTVRILILENEKSREERRHCKRENEKRRLDARWKSARAP